MEAVARPEANPHGPPVAPGEAPEAITQAVASLPPEQMFELMKQMKVYSSFSLTWTSISSINLVFGLLKVKLW